MDSLETENNSVKDILKGLAKTVGQDILAQLDRKPIDDYLLNGFIVGMSDRLVLLHVVDGSTLILNGYAAVRLADIKRFSADDAFVYRALRLLDQKPVIPSGINLSDWRSLLTSANEKYPLIMIECEKKEPGCGLIGRVEKLTAREVRLKKIDSQARWIETESFQLRDITQVTFDNGYINALSLVAAHEATNPEHSS
jgi:hypothetical protein